MHRTEKTFHSQAKPNKTLPGFEGEAGEGAFCESYDSAEYVEWVSVISARFPNRKYSANPILIHTRPDDT
jgi:hypothetical protein